VFHIPWLHICGMRHDDPNDLKNEPPNLDDGNLRDDPAATTHAMCAVEGKVLFAMCTVEWKPM